MIRFLFVMSLFFKPINSKADLFGADLPLLTEIVFNTLHTMMELEAQTTYMRDELAGIRDKIYRIQTISEMVKPSEWEQWKNPKEAVNRLRTIYYTMPKEFRSEKSDLIEQEISKAMNLISRLQSEAQTTFHSGKELERRGANASPGVAQKLAASGIGSLIVLESQSQILQSHITSLLTQMLAEGNERETRAVVSKGASFNSISDSFGKDKSSFSIQVLAFKASL